MNQKGNILLLLCFDFYNLFHNSRNNHINILLVKMFNSFFMETYKFHKTLP